MGFSKHMAVYNSSAKREQHLSNSYNEHESLYHPGNPLAPQTARVQIEKAVDVLFRNKWVLLSTFCICVLGAIAFSFLQEPEYEAYSSILVDLGSAQEAKENLTLRAEDPFARNDRSLDAELFIIRSSNTIAERVAERLLAIQDTAQHEIPLSVISTDNGPLTSAQAIAWRLMRYVSFSSAMQGINVIIVRAKSHLPYEAALLANLYSEEYIRMTRDASRTHVTSMREFLEAQEYERREELRLAEEAIQVFMTERGTSGVKEENRMTLIHLIELEAQRDRLSLDYTTRKSKLASIREALTEIHPNLVANIASSKNRQIESLQEEIAELEISRTQIQLRYTNQPERLENEPELDLIQTQIKNLQNQVKELSNSYVDEVLASGGTGGVGKEGVLTHVADLRTQAIQQQIEINGLEAQLAILEARIQERKEEMALVPENTMQLARLQRNRVYAEQMYEFVISQLQTTQLNEVSEPGYAQVIREASIPFAPVRPRPIRNILIGILLGIAAGVGFAFLRDSMATEVIEPEQLHALGFPLMSVVPDMGAYINRVHDGALSKEWMGRSVDTTLVTLFDPASAISEAYRNIQAKIEYSMPVVDARTLLVTSACAGDGKSVTAANLAITMARAGKKTILVDTDLRRPSVHELFGLSNSTGLSELYRRRPAFEWTSTRTPLKNFYILPAGRLLKNPVEVIGLERTGDIIALLQEWFDVIIFDTPPVLMATETKMLAAQCHGTIVVAKASRTKQDDLEHTIEELQSVNASVIGTVLNGFDATTTIRYRNRYRYYSQLEELPA